jgi:hypothetical protein
MKTKNKIHKISSANYKVESCFRFSFSRTIDISCDIADISLSHSSISTADIARSRCLSLTYWLALCPSGPPWSSSEFGWSLWMLLAIPGQGERLLVYPRECDKAQKKTSKNTTRKLIKSVMRVVNMLSIMPYVINWLYDYFHHTKSSAKIACDFL